MHFSKIKIEEGNFLNSKLSLMTDRILESFNNSLGDLNPKYLTYKKLAQIEKHKFSSNLLDSNKNISKTFFEVIERNNNNNLNQQKTDELYLLLSNQYYDSVYSSLQKDFPDISKIFDEINLAIHNFNKESQIKKNPVVNILISGFYNDIVVTHDTINIGIDYFLQLNNKYKPRDLPTYILKRYTPQFLIPTILISYFSQFNLMNINDESLLNEMIAFGKLYYVISKLIPCIDENIILGYDKEEWEILEKTEAFVYSYFIQNELFFEKNHLIKNKYINERPNVFEISPNHPGRIARWLGWKIVKSYIKSNLRVSQIRNSDVVNLNVSSRNPELAKFLLEKVIEAYLKYDVDTKVKITNYANAQINLRLSNLLEQMEQSEQKLLAYKKENNLILNLDNYKHINFKDLLSYVSYIVDYYYRNKIELKIKHRDNTFYLNQSLNYEIDRIITCYKNSITSNFFNNVAAYSVLTIAVNEIFSKSSRYIQSSTPI